MTRPGDRACGQPSSKTITAARSALQRSSYRSIAALRLPSWRGGGGGGAAGGRSVKLAVSRCRGVRRFRASSPSGRPRPASLVVARCGRGRGRGRPADCRGGPGRGDQGRGTQGVIISGQQADVVPCLPGEGRLSSLRTHLRAPSSVGVAAYRRGRREAAKHDSN